MFKTLEWTADGVVMIDQRKLPGEEVYPVFRNYHEVAQAIKDMVVRGAPAIGVAAAMGVALGAREIQTKDPQEFAREFEAICKTLSETRPTAVNLFWAIERMRKCCKRFLAEGDLDKLKELLREEALRIYEEDITLNRRMGAHGAGLLKSESRVLTHCNAGALATAGFGTALGVIRAAVEQGKQLHVFADETRPFLQGARLTAWELQKDHIPVTLITDNMAGYFLKKGHIDCVIVGADRIAANGDVANKIGTYSVAVLAKENGIPFYVAAPISTLDLSLPTGEQIPIEQRPRQEVTHFGSKPVAPEGIEVENPAFDVTPHRYITAIITELGIARPPFVKALRELAQGS
ncbi:MAG: S-methyl-5-thioribose-1-phosphate isomerase [Terriglobia bacterium]